MFRLIRIVILLIVLVVVGGGAWLTKLRTTAWERPLRVTVFPINGDGSPGTAEYIQRLQPNTFRPIDAFMQEQGARYKLSLSTPVELSLAPEIYRIPPRPPFGGNPVQIILWSLQMRYWAWVNAEYTGPKPDVRMIVLYYNPDNVTSVEHSLGLQKGLIGVVHAFASDDQAAQNNVIIAHEMLHTVGATDKYDPGTNQPLFPNGYAEPYRQPLLPQTFAEIMGGRVPVTMNDAQMPADLEHVVIGPATAHEINWNK